MTEKVKNAVVEYQEDFDTIGPDLVRNDMLAKGFTEQEATEVISALSSDSTAPVATKPVAAKPKAKAATEVTTYDPENPNNSIADKLKSFNYQNLEHEELARYYELLESLPHNQMYDFEVHKVKVLRQERFEGVPNSPVDVVGVVLESTKPLISTRVYPQNAIAQNGRLVRGRNYFEIVGQQFHENKRFYILKK
jgi:hypothetical protein